jgi:hypothetical protein
VGLDVEHPTLARAFAPGLLEHDLLIRVLLSVEKLEEANMGRGILLWLLGVPIPVIILLWLFFGH